MRTRAFVGVVLFLFSAACGRAALTPEEQKTLQDLRTELAKVRQAAAEAQTKDESLAGGLVKALVSTRLEILKTTEALLQQRIHALEGGAKLSIQVSATQPDLSLTASLEKEISAQQKQLDAARADAAQYSGGLVHALKNSTLATQEQTLAMLQQRFLIAKYGLGIPRYSVTGTETLTTSAASASPTNLETAPSIPKDSAAENIVTVHLLNKKFTEQDYQKFIFFDIEFTAAGLEKPARAIKGRLNLNDLFGETKMRLGWTIEKEMRPGATIAERGSGFKYNQFMNEHQWVLATDLTNMTATFTVQSILFKDGSRKDFN